MLPLALRALTAAAALAAQPTSAVSRSVPADTLRPLPAPGGAHRVGTTIAYLVDSSRSDPEFPAGRPITLQLWYPTADTRGRMAPYLVERGLDSLLLQGYYGLDSATIRSWSVVRTHARLNASPTAGTHPLLTFCVGLGVVRANYTSLAEAMASHGWIVALVEAPDEGMLILPDGRVVQDTAGRSGTPAGHRAAVEQWSGDVRFALDRLQARRVSRAANPVARTIDWTRVAATGHSSGGIVAIAAAEHDPRIRVAIDLDGGMAAPTGEPIADFVARGITKTTLLLRSEPIYSDADFARRGTTREQWVKGGAGGRAGLDTLVARSSGALWLGSVAGTGHFSFTDAPFVMPTTISRFGGRIIAPSRGLEVTITTMRWFLDHALAGTLPADTPQALTTRFPELTLRRPAH